MEGKMKVAVMEGIGKMGFTERPIPTPKDDEVLVKLEYVGICGSDLHYYEHGRIGDYIVEPPFVLGHEPGGTVVEVGKDVKHLKVGDRVALEPGKTCGHCEFCKTGKYNLCPDVIFFATPPVDGVFQEYVAHEADLCFKLPDNVDTMEGALIEPLAVGFHAAKQGGAAMGQTAVVTGSLTDQITVFRDGCLIGSVATKDVTPEKLINMMVGRELNDVYDKSSPKTADYDENEVLLKVENLTRENEFYNINFEVKRGEILGFFGLMGAGRTEVMDTVFGLRKAEKGTVTMKGNQMGTVKKAISNGMAYITEDRKISGLNLIASVKDNISIAYMDMITKGKFLIDFKKEKEISDELIKKIKIKCSSRDTLAGTLSGGNQQKIVIAKWFMGNPDLLIMDEPTRGIDIGAKAEIYKLMDMLVKSGKSIIMISSETPELLGMSDRVIVMHEGYQTGEFKCGELNQDKLMAYAIGEGGKYHQ